MINQKTFKYCIYTFLFFYSVNYIFFTYRFFVRENGFILGDWLINYSGGFVRRGLLGEIIVNFVDFFSLNIINTTFILILVIFIFFIYYLIKLINRSNISFLLAIIILSPATLLFNFIDPLAIGRKEIIFFLFLLIYFELRDKVYFNLLLIPASIIAMLSHEMFLLLIPFFFISRFFMNFDFKFKNFYLEILILLISIVYLITLFYTDPNVSKMCSRLLEFKLNNNVCWAIGTTKKNSIVIAHYVTDFYYVTYYLIFFVLIFSPIYLILTDNFSQKCIISLFLILITILPFCLLFLIVNDWGRYLNVFAIYWMIILLNLSKNKQYKEQIKYIHIVIIFLFSSSWYMPHCCPEIHFKDKRYNPSIKYVIERIYYRSNEFSKKSF